MLFTYCLFAINMMFSIKFKTMMADNEIEAKRDAFLQAKRQLIVKSHCRPTFKFGKAFF